MNGLKISYFCRCQMVMSCKNKQWSGLNISKSSEQQLVNETLHFLPVSLHPSRSLKPVHVSVFSDTFIHIKKYQIMLGQSK